MGLWFGYKDCTFFYRGFTGEAIAALGLVEHRYMRLDPALFHQPMEHLGRTIGRIGGQPLGVKPKPTVYPLDHDFGCCYLGLPDGGRGFDIDNDRVVEIDQIVGGIGEECRPRWAPVQRAAGSAGDRYFGVTSVAAPKAAASRTARYSSMARLAISGGSPFDPSTPF